jgi:hypothetical protein
VEDAVKTYLVNEVGLPSWGGIKNAWGGVKKGNWYLGQTYKTGKYASQFNSYAKQAQDALAQLKNIAKQTNNKEIADEITNTSRMLGKASTGFARMAKNTQKPGNAMNTSVQNPWGNERVKQQQAMSGLRRQNADLQNQNAELQNQNAGLQQPFNPSEAQNGWFTPPSEYFNQASNQSWSNSDISPFTQSYGAEQAANTNAPANTSTPANASSSAAASGAQAGMETPTKDRRVKRTGTKAKPSAKNPRVKQTGTNG